MARLSKLVVELEWAILAEAIPGPEEINPLTATTEELKRTWPATLAGATPRRADLAQKKVTFLNAKKLRIKCFL